MSAPVSRRAPSLPKWLPVVGYEGLYEVSDHGEVRSLDKLTRGRYGPRLVRGTLLRATMSNNHLAVGLCREGEQNTRRVHHLVLESFVGPRPEGKQGLHWDDDPYNNHIENLRWGTRSENMQDRIRNGRNYNLNKTHCHRGHEFTSSNTLWRKDGGRSCRECKRQRDRKS